MSREQANDLYWVANKIAEMSLEMATPDTDHLFTADTFDDLYDYIARNADFVEGGMTFRLNDGRGIVVSIVLGALTESRDEG